MVFALARYALTGLVRDCAGQPVYIGWPGSLKAILVLSEQFPVSSSATLNVLTAMHGHVVAVKSFMYPATLSDLLEKYSHYSLLLIVISACPVSHCDLFSWHASF